MDSGFSLEIDNWGNWNRERVFARLDDAKRCGYSEFSQNIWRISNSITGLVIFTYDPSNQIQIDALRELQRFETTNYFRMNFQSQLQASSEHRELRSRRRQLVRRNEEIVRLSVGPLSEYVGRYINAPFPSFLDMSHEEDYATPKLNVKINWKSEGF